MSLFADNHFIISMLFTLSIGICLFMYIHQKYNIIEKKMAELNQYLVQWIQQIQKPHTPTYVDEQVSQTTSSVANDGDIVSDELKNIELHDHKIDISDDDHSESDESDNDDQIQTIYNVMNSTLETIERNKEDSDRKIINLSDNFQHIVHIEEVNLTHQNNETVEVAERDKDYGDGDDGDEEEDDDVEDMDVECNEYTTSIPDYKNMQVSSLKELIKSLGIQVKSIAKYKKIELIEMLDTFYQSDGSLENTYHSYYNDDASNVNDTDDDCDENNTVRSTKSTVVLDNVFLQEETHHTIVNEVETNDNKKD